MAFDSSQQSTQDEPDPTQEEATGSEQQHKKPRSEGQSEPESRKKRKDRVALTKVIGQEVRKTKAAKTDECQTQLANRSAVPPTKAAIRSSSEPPPSTAGSGYGRIHRSHKRCRLSDEITFCWHCGYWMAKKSERLSTQCEPAGLSSHQRSMREKLRLGFYPQAFNGAVKLWRNGTSTTKPVPIEWIDLA